VAGQAATAARDLHPASFAFVMATGIISIGNHLLGPSWLSVALLVIASAGFVGLGVMVAARLVFYRPRIMADLRAPDQAFGFFSITAALVVLGVRYALAGHPLVTAVLAAVAAAAWLVLTYGVPASLILTRTDDSVLGSINGSWLLWIVGTEALSVGAATVIPAWPSQAGLLAPFAAALWCIGLLLYLTVVGLIMLRWLSVPMTPATLGPPYWILMGATAISVLAGAHVIELPKTIPVIAATAGFTEGFSFALWAFGTWWVPLLLILGLWRHVRRQWPLSYEPGLWSIVFPLGMYSVATLTYGEAARLAFMHPIARVMIWVSVGAWVLVAAAFLLRHARNLRPSGASTSPAAD
jgi:tellurite resistance protein TehA-like permease